MTTNHPIARAPRPALAAALLSGLVLAATGCAGLAPTGPAPVPDFDRLQVTTHRDGDDLLTAGLGLAGLQSMAPPAFADPAAPTPGELRRRAIWNNWRGIADLSPTGGYGSVYGSVADVPGREFTALARVDGARHPHRVLVQVPDAFDRDRRCVVVTASSGSRGVHGAIAVAGAWGLPKGCAVAYTDKGAGSDYFDLDAGQGVAVDGRIASAADGGLAFAPDAPAGGAGVRGVAVKHAHSGDNPEADWGRHVRQAAQFALHALDEAVPQAAPFTFDNTRVIAVGISNGGGAVLRAAELEGDWLDAVVAGEPSIHTGGTSLYDYATQAALLMPCALLDASLAPLPQPPLAAQSVPQWTARCSSLKAAGLVDGDDTSAQAASALAQLRETGWTDDALRAGALSVGFDLWRAVAVTYASAYGRYGVGAHPCGYGFAALDERMAPRVATSQERAAWWADGSGIPPGAGVGIVDDLMSGPDANAADPTFPGLMCLRQLATGGGDAALRVQSGIDAMRAAPPREGLPVVVVHGRDDGLVPMALSSAPYVAMARQAGRDVRFWQVGPAQHFDAFLALPDYGARYLPLLPYVYAALDRVEAHLDGSGALPADAVIDATARESGRPLEASQLAMPR